MSDFLKRDPIEQYPPVYKNMKDIQVIAAAEHKANTNLYDDIRKYEDDMFLATASEDAITRYEKIAGIVSDPSVENLNFRRERVINRYDLSPPFTVRFFTQKFNDIIGTGKWQAYLNKDRTILTVESSAINQLWFEEIEATIEKLKPASVIFINKPTLVEQITINETAIYKEIEYLYKLGMWELGRQAFGKTGSDIVTIGEETMSITNNFLCTMAEDTANSIAKVIINNEFIINDFTVKKSVGNTATIEYTVAKGELEAITNIQFASKDDSKITDSTVYIPMVSDVVLKHTIKIAEGGVSSV